MIDGGADDLVGSPSPRSGATFRKIGVLGAADLLHGRKQGSKRAFVLQLREVPAYWAS